MILDRINRVCMSGGHRVWLLIILVVVVVILLIVRNGASTLQSYQDPQTGVSFAVPGNWRVKKGERSLGYAVTPKWKVFSRDSAYIDVLPRLISHQSISYTLEGSVKEQIERLNVHFFRLDEVNIIQPIRIIASEKQTMATVTISVPTISIPDNTIMNQMGQKDPNVFQIIDIYTIENDSDYYATVIVYKGTSERLNAQADEIVKSIRFDEGEQP